MQRCIQSTCPQYSGIVPEQLVPSHTMVLWVFRLFFFFSPQEENSNKLQGDSRQWCQKGMNYLRKNECIRKPLSIRTCKHPSIPRTRSAIAFPLTELLMAFPRLFAPPGAPQKQRLGISIHVDGGRQSIGPQVYRPLPTESQVRVKIPKE